MTSSPPDPMSVFREAVSQWEKFANDYGGQLLARPETAQAMQGMTAINLQIQAAVHEAMAKALAAANMPSKADIEAIGARLSAIEAKLDAAPRAAQQSAALKPLRTRQPKPKA